MWEQLAAVQHGMISQRQLSGLGIPRAEVRHHLLMRRWAQRTSSVFSTTTGPLSWDQRLWLAALHAGPEALIGGLTAAKLHGLRNWDRDDITVLVANPLSFEPVEGVRFFRTRRPLHLVRCRSDLPLCRLEPAILLFAGYEPHHRTAHGAIAAVVQQRLTTPDALRRWIVLLTPLRRGRQFQHLLEDLDGGAQSLAEVDVRAACRRFHLRMPKSQTRRRDRRGRLRYTDCEWRLPDGRVLVLEVDGAFHDDYLQAADDKARNRALTSPDRVVVACTAYELRYRPEDVVADLIALGVPRVL
jgi:hypothetical protein